MQVRLLGPVDVVADGAPRPVRGLRRKAVLAALALHRGEVVSTGRAGRCGLGRGRAHDRGEHAAESRVVPAARAGQQGRDPRPAARLRPGSAGDGTDVRLAERLLRQGAAVSRSAPGARHLQAALALWRGRPLADLAGLPWLEEQAERLDLLGRAGKAGLVRGQAGGRRACRAGARAGAAGGRAPAG